MSSGLISRNLMAILALLCFSLSSQFTQAQDVKPNIVVILADDLGAMDLGCYGSKFHRTPNLDKLAKMGVRFTQAYAATPVCSPSRAALMTGLAPARIGLTDWLPGRADRPDQKLKRPDIPIELAPEYVTLAENLKKRGYSTAHIGKWHLGGGSQGPGRQGFDLNVAGDDTGTPRSYFAPYKNGMGVFMPGLEEAPKGEYLTDRLTTEAVKFIENQSKSSTPFFLYMPHYAVHTPMRAKQEIVDQYAPKEISPGRQRNPIYAAMLQSLDESVGRILESLEKHQLLANTLIVFTSDNGGLATTEGPNTPATSNAPLREGKGWLYEGGLRVPMIISGAGVKSPGRESAEPVILMDLFPTIISKLDGVKAPEGSFDGHVIQSLDSENPDPSDRPLFWHYPHYANQGGRPGGVIREGNYKLLEFYENGRLELFDLAKDPGESRNLSAEMPEKVHQLASRLEQWRAQVGAKMPVPNKSYLANPQNGQGNIVLPASRAEVNGLQLRYEPQPHKNTLGFWVRVEDTAFWDFTVTEPGKFEVVGLIGCGPGQGGSRVSFIVDDNDALELEVPDTGGFQAFREITLGQVDIPTKGMHRMLIKPIFKAKAAVMDVREVRLKKIQ